MDTRDVQSRLKTLDLYDGQIDGDAGPKTKAGVRALILQQSVSGYEMWPFDRRLVAAKQLICRIDGIEVGAVDGLAGMQTRHALAVWDARKANAGKPDPKVESWRDDEKAAPATGNAELPSITSSHASAPSTKPQWPRQIAMESFYGAKGSNQATLILPYKMRIAWELGSTVSKFSCHQKVRESLERIFVRTLDHYGLDEIQRLRLDLYGGCLNVRKMRGGSAWSIHSWGCAVDIDPDHNALTTHKPSATLSRPEYNAWWSFVYDEGAIGLGRERDYDWMHFQFARL